MREGQTGACQWLADYGSRSRGVSHSKHYSRPSCLIHLTTPAVLALLTVERNSCFRLKVERKRAGEEK